MGGFKAQGFRGQGSGLLGLRLRDFEDFNISGVWGVKGLGLAGLGFRVGVWGREFQAEGGRGAEVCGEISGG